MNKIIPVWFSFYILLLFFFVFTYVCVCVSIILNCFFVLLYISRRKKKIFTDNRLPSFSKHHHQCLTVRVHLYVNNRIIYVVNLFFLFILFRKKKEEMCDNNSGSAWRRWLSFSLSLLPSSSTAYPVVLMS